VKDRSFSVYLNCLTINNKKATVKELEPLRRGAKNGLDGLKRKI